MRKTVSNEVVILNGWPQSREIGCMATRKCILNKRRCCHPCSFWPTLRVEYRENNHYNVVTYIEVKVEGLIIREVLSLERTDIAVASDINFSGGSNRF